MTCSPDHPQTGTIQIPISLSGERRSVACVVHGMRGRRLLIDSEEQVPLSLAVSVEVDDSMFLGEVVTCTKSDDHCIIELKIEQILTGLHSLMALRNQLLDQPVAPSFGFIPAGVLN